jgi:hypothetical protein
MAGCVLEAHSSRNTLDTVTFLGFSLATQKQPKDPSCLAHILRLTTARFILGAQFFQPHRQQPLPRENASSQGCRIDLLSQNAKRAEIPYDFSEPRAIADMPGQGHIPPIKSRSPMMTPAGSTTGPILLSRTQTLPPAYDVSIVWNGLR